MTTFKRRKQNTIDKLEAEYLRDNNAEMLQVVNYLKHAGKNRRPGSMVPRVAASRTANSNYLPAIKPPYNNSSLDRFEDCFRSDKLIQNAIVKRTELAIGQHGKIVMDTTEEFDIQDDRNAAVEKINNNTAYQEAKKQIQKLHVKPGIDFHNKLKAALIQSKVYGRSAIEMVGSSSSPSPSSTITTTTTEKEGVGVVVEKGGGLPEALHVLNSKRLAQVEIDPATWNFLGVHYLDLQKGPSGQDDVLLAEDLIYFTNRDYHVSPGSLYYGLSELEGVIDGSDSKRIAKQEDIKEIMKSNWAPFLILKFINPNISVTQMQEVVNGMQPGLPFAHKQDIDTQMLSLEGDLKKLTDAVDFLNRESLRELGVPAFVGGYEQIANYANSQQILLAYKEIELEADRTTIKDTIQPQWLNRLFYMLLGIDEENADVKLSYEFADISFETNLDKMNSSLPLFDRQLISGEKVLKIAGYEDEIEEYKLRKEEIERNKELMRQQFMQQQNNTQQDGEDQGDQQDSEDNNNKPNIPFQQQKTVSTTMRKRQASLYKKFEETLDAISRND